jgi:hypothetical protein
LLTYNGRDKKECGTMKDCHDHGDVYIIKTYGTSNYEITAKHTQPFLTKDRGLVKTEDLTTNDWLLIPINKTVNDISIISIPYVKLLANQFGKQEIQQTIQLKLDNNLLTIIGYYLAEGNLSKNDHGGYNRTVFTFSGKECDLNHINELENSIKNLGFKTSKYFRNQYNTCIVEFSSTVFANWLNKEFGHGAKNKKLPQWLIELPNEKTEIIFEKYMNGDGYKVSKGKHNSRHVKSISENLILGMRDIALRLGYKTSIRKQKIENGTESAILGRKVKINTPYELYISKVTGTEYSDKNKSRMSKHDYKYKFNTKIRIDSNYQYNKIRSIERNCFNEIVYDLKVDDNHSYSVENKNSL